MSWYNLLAVDEAESWEEFVWADVQRELEWPWMTTWRTRRLAKDGMFGIVCSAIDNLGNVQDDVKPLIDGDCEVCGQEDVGNVPEDLRGAYETADGGHLDVTSWDVVCRGCAERIIHDAKNYGEPQPTLTSFAD